MDAILDVDRQKRLLMVGIAAVAVCVAVLLVSAGAAKAWTTGAVNFCYGVTLPGGPNTCGSTSENKIGYLTEVSGSGADHSVCVRGAGVGIKMCSGGPLQGVYNSSPPGTSISYGEIINNAAGANKVYGGAYFCVTPGC